MVYVEEPFYSGHPWERKVSLIERCPHFRGQNVRKSNVIQCNLSIPYIHPWDRKVSLIERCPHFRGQNAHILNVWGRHRMSFNSVSIKKKKFFYMNNNVHRALLQNI